MFVFIRFLLAKLLVISIYHAVVESSSTFPIVELPSQLSVMLGWVRTDDCIDSARSQLPAMVVEHPKEAVIMSRISLVVPLFDVLRNEMRRGVCMHRQQGVERLQQSSAHKPTKTFRHPEKRQTLVGLLDFGSR